jgi:protein gp37
MSEQTKISWCDSTINFWRGCTKVSPGCANCYAETLVTTRLQGEWGKGKPRQHGKGAVKDALAFNRKPFICESCGEGFSQECQHDNADGKNKNWTNCCVVNPKFDRRRIFSLSLGDWLDEEVPIEWLAEMLDTIRQCRDVTWILCSKRPHLFNTRIELAQDYDFDHGKRELCGWLRDWRKGDLIPPNIILLTSVENQAMADKRIPELLKIPSVCRGLSLEPLLGPVDLSPFLIGNGFPIHVSAAGKAIYAPGDGIPIQWIIIGGESGPKARPCNVDWIRALVRQGRAAGVATFVKQMGANPVVTMTEANRHGPPPDDFRTFTDKKGGDPAEWPIDLRIQEFPKL